MCISEVMDDATLFICKPHVMESLRGVFMINGMNELATSEGNEVFKGEDFKLGKEGIGWSVRLGFCDHPDGFFLHLVDFFNIFLSRAAEDGETVKEVGVY